MKDITLTRSNLSAVIESTLIECIEEEKKAKCAPPSHLLMDLAVAIHALQSIQNEIKTGVGRPQGKRSAEFIRYVIDERPTMVMKPELVKFIEQIEDFYDRFF
jgi:hypothetical protein